ncbi:MAG: carboxypeptidase-like regulatory domain-containing protein [Euryarchaeota archaeon]|nr:carboxypeptidase-like regulatory domain-containing protein [Euryarchaeota archaeon]
MKSIASKAFVIFAACLLLGSFFPSVKLASAQTQVFTSPVPQVNQTKLISGLRITNITAPVLIVVEKIDYKTNNSIELIDSSLDKVILTKPTKVEARVFENVTGIFSAETFNQTVITALTQSSAIGNLYAINKESFTAKYGITTQLKNLNSTDLKNESIKIDQIIPGQNLIASYSIKKDPSIKISFDWKNIELNSKEILFDTNNTLEFKICLNNTSPTQLNNAKAIIPLPSVLYDYQNYTVGGTQLISVEPENFVYDSVTKTLTWNGTVAPNSKAELIFKLKIKPSGLKWPLNTNLNFFLNSSISYNSDAAVSGLKIRDIVGNDFYLILVQNKTYSTSENLELNALVQSVVLKDLSDYVRAGIKIHELELAYLDQVSIDPQIKSQILQRINPNKNNLTQFLNYLKTRAQNQISEAELAISKNSSTQAAAQLELARKYFALEKYEWSYTNALGAEVTANPNKESEAKNELNEYYKKADVELKKFVSEASLLNDYLDARVSEGKLSIEVANQLKYYGNLVISILTKAINYVENKLTQLGAAIPIHRFFELPKIGFASAQEILAVASIEIKVIEKAAARCNKTGKLIEFSAFGEIWILNKESYAINNVTVNLANYSATNITGSIHISKLEPGWSKVAVYSISKAPSLELKEDWISKTVELYLQNCSAKGWISSKTAQAYNSSRILFAIDNSLLFNISFKNSADFNLTNITAVDLVPDLLINVSFQGNGIYNSQTDSLTIPSLPARTEVPFILTGVIKSQTYDPNSDYISLTKSTKANYSTLVPITIPYIQTIQNLKETTQTFSEEITTITNLTNQFTINFEKVANATVDFAAAFEVEYKNFTKISELISILLNQSELAAENSAKQVGIYQKLIETWDKFNKTVSNFTIPVDVLNTTLEYIQQYGFPPEAITLMQQYNVTQNETIESIQQLIQNQGRISLPNMTSTLKELKNISLGYEDAFVDSAFKTLENRLGINIYELELPILTPTQEEQARIEELKNKTIKAVDEKNWSKIISSADELENYSKYLANKTNIFDYVDIYEISLRIKLAGIIAISGDPITAEKQLPDLVLKLKELPHQFAGHIVYPYPDKTEASPGELVKIKGEQGGVWGSNYYYYTLVNASGYLLNSPDPTWNCPHTPLTQDPDLRAQPYWPPRGQCGPSPGWWGRIPYELQFYMPNNNISVYVRLYAHVTSSFWWCCGDKWAWFDGNYWSLVRYNGWWPAPATSPYTQYGPINIKVKPPVVVNGTIQGTIVNPRGKGIVGATVNLINPVTKAVVNTVSTDSAGRYSASVPAGGYQVQSKATGTYANTKSATAKPAETTITKTTIGPSVESKKLVTHGNEALPKQENGVKALESFSKEDAIYGVALIAIGLAVAAFAPGPAKIASVPLLSAGARYLLRSGLFYGVSKAFRNATKLINESTRKVERI